MDNVIVAVTTGLMLLAFVGLVFTGFVFVVLALVNLLDKRFTQIIAVLAGLGILVAAYYVGMAFLHV